jgi:hypothetical protein
LKNRAFSEDVTEHSWDNHRFLLVNHSQTWEFSAANAEYLNPDCLTISHIHDFNHSHSPRGDIHSSGSLSHYQMQFISKQSRSHNWQVTHSKWEAQLWASFSGPTLSELFCWIEFFRGTTVRKFAFWIAKCTFEWIVSICWELKSMFQKHRHFLQQSEVNFQLMEVAESFCER